MNSNDIIKNAKILVIDEDVNMMEIISEILTGYGHTVVTFTEPVSAIEELKSSKYDLLIVNYLMSPVNGDRVVELVREFDKEIYIILMSMHRDLAPSIETMQNLDIQAYFEKSSRFDQLIIMIQSGIKYIEQIRKVKSMNLKLDQYLFDFAQILLNTITAKDHYTGEHSKRVKAYCELFAKSLGLSSSDTENLLTAASFHDVGKIGIPDSVLLKNGKLTDDEYDTIKLHPVIAANIFSVSDIFDAIVPIIKHHHERYDGNGYPDKLKGDAIEYLARILSICDSFDAIVSKRPYKDECSIEEALEEIKKSANTQFDGSLSEKFIDTINQNMDHVKDIIVNNTSK
ncbi:MAG: HD domain-containing protein [Clostridia bacterium]|nr:HD domain-containing protein [Clostridia bacterium]